MTKRRKVTVSRVYPMGPFGPRWEVLDVTNTKAFAVGELLTRKELDEIETDRRFASVDLTKKGSK